MNEASSEGSSQWPVQTSALNCTLVDLSFSRRGACTDWSHWTKVSHFEQHSSSPGYKPRTTHLISEAARQLLVKLSIQIDKQWAVFKNRQVCIVVLPSCIYFLMSVLPLPVGSLLKVLWDTIYTAPNKSYISVSKASKEKGVRCVTPPSLSSPLLFWKLFQISFPLVGLNIQMLNVNIFTTMTRPHCSWETFRHLLLWTFTKAIRKPQNI